MCSGCRMPGTPAAATTISARWVYRGQSGTPVCTTVTAAFAVGRFCESSSASGPAEGGAAPEDADLVAGDRDLVVGEQGLDAGRGARAPGPASTAPAGPCSPGACRRRPCRGPSRAARRRSRSAAASGAAPGSRRRAGSSLNARTAARTSAWVASLGQVDVRRRAAELLAPSPASCGRSRRWRRRRRPGSCRARGVAVGDQLLAPRLEVGEHRVGDRPARHHLRAIECSVVS